MKLVTEKQVWLISASITAMACAIVAATVLFVYPREELPFEMLLSLSLTTVISVPVTYFMGLKMHENAMLSERLQDMLDHDRLTGAVTREFFFNKMRTAPGVEGVALMIDIDHFKKVNDTFGHFAGDAVIKAVAGTMQDNLRPEDLVCRFGGEEFMIFLPDRDHDQGLQSAETLRVLVSEVAVMFGKQRIGVTVSIGGSVKTMNKPIDLAIREADAALYRAKNEGRDQTVFVSSPQANAT